MPTFIGHAIFSLSLTPLRPFKPELIKTIWIAMICSAIPDLDVLGFYFGIPYGSMWGHRGFSHSLLFALILASLVSVVFYGHYRKDRKKFIMIIFLFFLCTASHGVLDALTDGGKGVGFFIPFHNERYFFPYRPLPVAPLGFENMFSKRMWEILLSEVFIIGIWSIITFVITSYWRKLSIDRN